MALALALAVSDDHVGIAEALINHVDAKTVNKRNLMPFGRTLLHVATRNDNATIARLLLEVGADVDAVTDDDLTALHVAVGNRSTTMVELLLKFGARVDPPRKFNGRTPLYMAVEYSCHEIVEMLIDKGAKLSTTAKQGFGNALHLALLIGDPRIAIALTRCVDASLVVNAKSQHDGKTPLQLAIENGQYEVVKQLIKKGANVDDNDAEEARTPLMLAIRRGDEKIVSLLLRHVGKSLQAKVTACLHQAVRLRRKKIVELLLAKGKASMDCRGADGKTALQIAVECGYKDMIKLCLTHEASLDYLDNKSASVSRLLHEAVKTNDTAMAELLLKRGAPVNDYVARKIRPLDVAVRARYIGMTKLLLRHGAFINDKSKPEEKIFALKYAVLALAQGRKIQRANRKLMRADAELSQFYATSREELKRAKSDAIVAGVTFFDMLTGDEHSLAAYARRHELVRAFPNCGYRDRYRVYADTLALNYAKGRLRSALLQKASADFEREFGASIDSARYIFRLMSNDDLRTFVRTFCQCEDPKRHVCLPEIFVQF